MALDRAIAPGQGEPGGDRREVLLEALGKAGERLNPARDCLGDPGLEVSALGAPAPAPKRPGSGYTPGRCVGSAWSSWSTYSWASCARFASGHTQVNETARADGPCGRV